ncbi:MAG: hypothetical protein FWC91_07345, partial [Defluviitaleaceae bacterium]|nr:hypothetical protein [Defluviitaleaceae bacterium]
GLGIFSKRSLMELEWESHLLTHFIPVSVDNCFVLLGVWACDLYIDGYAIYQSINSSHFNKDMVIIGDFNSNARWDYKGQRKQTGRSHSDVVNWLQSRGLISAYHNIYGIEQGKEIVFTFYLYRHKDKGSHIDYCFVSADKLVNFTILDAEAWLNYSDHIPIIVNVTH